MTKQQLYSQLENSKQELENQRKQTEALLREVFNLKQLVRYQAKFMALNSK